MRGRPTTSRARPTTTSPTQSANSPRAFDALPLSHSRIPISRPESLERCVKDLGMVGALANGFSQIGDANTVAYYDQKQYWPFWQAIEELDVPFYLHPRNPLPQHAKIYEGHGWLHGPDLGLWAEDRRACSAADGLSGCSINIQIADHSRTHGRKSALRSLADRQYATAGLKPPTNTRRRKKSAHYFQNNFIITTSGNFHTPALLHTMIGGRRGPHHVFN